MIAGDWLTVAPLSSPQTDPKSLRAVLGIDRTDNLMTCTRGSGQSARHEAALYFGGCMPADTPCDEERLSRGIPAITPLPEASALLLISPTRDSSLHTIVQVIELPAA